MWLPFSRHTPQYCRHLCVAYARIQLWYETWVNCWVSNIVIEDATYNSSTMTMYNTVELLRSPENGLHHPISQQPASYFLPRTVENTKDTISETARNWRQQTMANRTINSWFCLWIVQCTQLCFQTTIKRNKKEIDENRSNPQTCMSANDRIKL